jgi:hypothetical protein
MQEHGKLRCLLDDVISYTLELTKLRERFVTGEVLRFSLMNIDPSTEASV